MNELIIADNIEKEYRSIQEKIDNLMTEMLFLFDFNWNRDRDKLLEIYLDTVSKKKKPFLSDLLGKVHDYNYAVCFEAAEIEFNEIYSESIMTSCEGSTEMDYQELRCEYISRTACNYFNEIHMFEAENISWGIRNVLDEFNHYYIDDSFSCPIYTVGLMPNEYDVIVNDSQTLLVPTIRLNQLSHASSRCDDADLINIMIRKRVHDESKLLR